jgi:hypothetical protein
MLVHHLQSVRYRTRFSRWSHHDSLSLPLTRATRSSRQTSLVASTRQSVRFVRSLAARFQAEQPRLHTRVCLLKWVGGKRACTLFAGTQDVALPSLEHSEQHREAVLSMYRKEKPSSPKLLRASERWLKSVNPSTWKSLRWGQWWSNTFIYSCLVAVQGSDPGGRNIFRTNPDKPWNPPSLLYNGYRASFPGG